MWHAFVRFFPPRMCSARIPVPPFLPPPGAVPLCPLAFPFFSRSLPPLSCPFFSSLVFPIIPPTTSPLLLSAILCSRLPAASVVLDDLLILCVITPMQMWCFATPVFFVFVDRISPPWPRYPVEPFIVLDAAYVSRVVCASLRHPPSPFFGAARTCLPREQQRFSLDTMLYAAFLHYTHALFLISQPSTVCPSLSSGYLASPAARAFTHLSGYQRSTFSVAPFMHSLQHRLRFFFRAGVTAECDPEVFAFMSFVTPIFLIPPLLLFCCFPFPSSFLFFFPSPLSFPLPFLFFPFPPFRFFFFLSFLQASLTSFCRILCICCALLSHFALLPIGPLTPLGPDSVLHVCATPFFSVLLLHRLSATAACVFHLRPSFTGKVVPFSVDF